MPQKFGDERTIEKLEIVEEYARLFVSILGGLDWAKTHYIDAFAGEGHLFVKGINELVTGSVTRMGKLGFDQFHFVELNRRKFKNLKNVIAELGINDKSSVYRKDANIALPEIIKGLSSKDRALVFIDPFGLALKWETLVKISEIPYCDIVYLVPCHAPLRGLPRKDKGEILPSMVDSITACFGLSKEAIREEFSSLSPQPDFFEGEEVFRDANSPKVENFFKARLNKIFKFVYDKPKRLKLLGKPTQYSIFLMTTNPSKPAQEAINRLGKQVFK